MPPSNPVLRDTVCGFESFFINTRILVLFSSPHKRLTGVPNELILDNIRHIHHDLHVPVIIRVPTIPGMNDSVEKLRRTAEFVHSLGEDVSLNLLPYHKLGESKNENLGHPFSLGIEPPDDKHMNTLLSIVRD